MTGVPSARPLTGAAEGTARLTSFPTLLAGKGSASLVEATGKYAAALAAYPWFERYPLALNGLRPANEQGDWVVYDAQNRRAPLAKNFLHGWTLLSLSGGYPLGLFGEWNGERLRPLSAWPADNFVAFRPRIE